MLCCIRLSQFAVFLSGGFITEFFCTQFLGTKKRLEFTPEFKTLCTENKWCEVDAQFAFKKSKSCKNKNVINIIITRWRHMSGDIN